MKLYIVRHGETEANKLNICQGQTNWPLSDKGVEQSKKIASRLSNINIDICYTSDLERAYQTAEIIKSKNHFNIIKDQRLRERCFGKMQGMKFSKEKINIEDVEGIESIEDMFFRIKSFFYELNYKKCYRNVLITTHGVTINIILSLLQNKVFNYEKDIIKIENTSLTIVNINKNKTKIELFNSIAHLSE